ncbi:MAG: hypothetical protein IPP67_04885 [Rhodospirillaceae bacterium]|nr:hypothetical protein [Rhodospirillaceae bacterium]
MVSTFSVKQKNSPAKLPVRQRGKNLFLLTILGFMVVLIYWITVIKMSG